MKNINVSEHISTSGFWFWCFTLRYTNQCKFSWIWRKKIFPPNVGGSQIQRGDPLVRNFFLKNLKYLFPFYSPKLIFWDFFRYFCFINKAPNGVCASVCMLKLKLYSAHTCTRCTKKLPRCKNFLTTGKFFTTSCASVCRIKF